jgi:hypothetical protein
MNGQSGQEQLQEETTSAVFVCDDLRRESDSEPLAA